MRGIQKASRLQLQSSMDERKVKAFFLATILNKLSAGVMEVAFSVLRGCGRAATEGVVCLHG